LGVKGLLSAILFSSLVGASSCAPKQPITTTSTTRPTVARHAKPEFNVLQTLHVRLEVNPADGSVAYFGWYDGNRNLLGPGGIMTALVGMEPPELKGELHRLSDAELVYDGVDQNQIAWVKRYRLVENTVRVTHQITSRRDQPFDAIIYSLADLPDATITGDNRDQYVQTPSAAAHFHATLQSPNFPGESMNPYALRSDTRHLEPGESMTFEMTWELIPGRGR